MALTNFRPEDFLPRCAPAKRFRFERHNKTLSQRVMTTYQLLIAIEHALPNWPLVDFRKESSGRPQGFWSQKALFLMG
jgi:hypothetical protein